MQAMKLEKIRGVDSHYDTFWNNIYEQMENTKSSFYIFSGRAWSDTTFQPPKDIVLQADCRYAFAYMYTKNFKSCIDDRGIKIDFSNMKYTNGIFVENQTEYIGELDFSSLINEVTLSDLFLRCVNLVTIDKIKLGNNVKIQGIPFAQCAKLQNVTFEGSLTSNISFAHSLLLSDASIQNIIDCLVDLTDSDTQTLTVHADVEARMTDEQKATITSKNWTLAVA